MSRKDKVKNKNNISVHEERRNGLSGSDSGATITAGRVRRPVQADSLLLAVQDLCGLLNISRSTLVRMEKVTPVPGRIMIGSSVRYHRPTIELWLKELAGSKSVGLI